MWNWIFWVTGWIGGALVFAPEENKFFYLVVAMVMYALVSIAEKIWGDG